MKKKIKLLAIIALTAVIGIFVSACEPEKDEPPANNPPEPPYVPTEHTYSYSDFVAGTTISFNPTGLPEGITYTLGDSITGFIGDTGEGFDGTVNASPYAHNDIPIFTQTFYKDGKEIGSYVIGIVVRSGRFFALMSTDGSKPLTDQTAFPPVKLTY